jgi:hypothetical protein
MKTAHKVEMTPVTDMSDEQLWGNAGHSIWTSHVGLGSSRLLDKRGLTHVDRNYTGGEMILHGEPVAPVELMKDRQAMLEGRRETYLLSTDVNTDREPYLGLGTIDHEAILRKTRVAHRIGRSLPIISKDIPTEGPRLSAWAGNIYPYSDQPETYNVLKDTYSQLLEKGNGGWTVEPFGAPDEVHQAIYDAGLVPANLEVALYDDQRSNFPVLPGILYQA